MFFRSKTKKAPTIETKPLKLASPMLALEPRYVFDAALASDILHSAEQLAGAPPHDTSAAQGAAGLFAAAGYGATLNEPLRDHAADAQVRALIDTLVDGRNAAASSQEIAFIDSRLSELAGIVSAIPEGTRIVMIDANRDGVEQMVEALRGEAGVTGIHIISHGQAGSLQLGRSTLDANTMSTVYKQQLESLHNNLSETADILVYGCNFGAGDAGAEATALLASLTGADVASSDDLTGSTDEGGDWVLETRAGAIDANAIDAAGWNDTLAATNSGSWSVSGLTATNVTAGVTTTITFTPNTANSAFGSVANQTFNTIPVFSNGADGDPSLSFIYTWDTSPEPIVTLPQPQASADTGIGTVTITFSQPVTNPIINLDRLGGNSAYDPNTLVAGDEENLSNGARWTLTSGGTLTKVSGTSHFDVTSSTIERTPNQAMPYTGTSSESGTDSTTNTAAGSVRVNGTFTTITFQLTGVGVEGGGQDGIEIGVIVDPPPNANNDTLSVAEDGTLTGNLYSNNGSGADADPQGDAITITQINGASFTVGTPIILANGTLTITNASTGAFTFLPNANYSGGQAFDYTISDPAGGTDTATATINVTAVNDPPLATPSTSSGDEDTPISVGLAGTDIDGTISSVKVTTLPPAAQGILYLADGTTPVVAGAALTPSQAAALVFIPATNFNGTVTIPFTVTDNGGAVSTPATEVITVNAVNDPPVATASTSSGDEDTPIAVNLTGTDLDGTISSVTVTTLPPAAQGILYMPNGTTPVAAGTPLTPADAAALVFIPATDFNGTVTVTFTVTDDDGAVSAPANEVITVNAVNDPPIATASTSSGDEDTPIAVNLTGTDLDGTISSVTVTTLPPAAQGILYMPNGTTPVATGTPLTPADAAALVFVPATNFNGTVTIPFTVTDDDGAVSAPANEVITVNDVNDPPLASPSTSSGDEDTPIAVDLTGTDVDGTIASVMVTALPPVAEGILYMPDGTTPVVAGTPIPAAQAANLVFVPATNFNGTVTFPFTVTDDDGATSAPANEVITVNDVNDPPVANPDTISTGYDTPVVVDLLGNDTDVDNDPLTVVSASVPADQGTLTNVGGVWTFKAAPGFTGTATITYTMRDPSGETASSTHSVIISNVPPVLTVPKPGGPFINPDDPLNLMVPAFDSRPLSLDLDTYFSDANGHTLTYTPNLSGLPAWVKYDPVTHTLSGKPPADNTGSITVPVLVEDGHGATLATTITFVITNPPPDAVDGKSTTEYATPIKLLLLANDKDPDGDPLTVTSVKVPASQGTLALVGGNWVFTPRTGFTGIATITYTIRDQDGATDTALHSVTVKRPPLIAKDDVFTVNFEKPLKASAAQGDVFAKGSVFKIEAPPSSGAVTMKADGSYVFVPKPGFSGKVTFTYRVTDPTGAYRVARETINVASQAHECLVTFGKKRR